jgi:hypothetical protein
MATSLTHLKPAIALNQRDEFTNLHRVSLPSSVHTRHADPLSQAFQPESNGWSGVRLTARLQPRRAKYLAARRRLQAVLGLVRHVAKPGHARTADSTVLI